MESSRNCGPWLFAAMTPLLAHFCGGSWAAILILGLVCGGACRLSSKTSPSRWVRFLQLCWSVVLLGSLGREMAAYWPGPQSGWVVPGAIFLLAAYGCTASPGRAGTVLCFVMLLLWTPLLAAGIREANLSRLLPAEPYVSAWLVIPLLLPLSTQRQAPGKWYAAAVLFGVTLSAIVGAVLPPMQQPLRILSRTLSLGGVNRMESLVSVAITIGWFCLAVWLLSGHTQKRVTPWLLALSAAAWSAFLPPVSDWWAVVGSVILWGVLPAFFFENFSKKSEKSS